MAVFYFEGNPKGQGKHAVSQGKESQENRGLNKMEISFSHIQSQEVGGPEQVWWVGVEGDVFTNCLAGHPPR